MFGYDVFGAPTNNTFRSEDSIAGWVKDPKNWTLKTIQTNCPNKQGGNETCLLGPFTQFTIRGTEGSEMDDGRWWWVDTNTLGLSNYDGGDKKSGSCEIEIREGYQVKLTVRFETEGEYGFMEGSFLDLSSATPGISSVTADSFTAILKGGDKLSVDIDDDWSGTAQFYLKVQGSDITNSNKSIDDEVYVTLEEVYIDPEDPPVDDDADDGADEEEDPNKKWMIFGGIAAVALLALKL